MTQPPLDLTRAQILAFRRASNVLNGRLPAGPDALRTAAWAGLQDSMPRAAILSIHARVGETQPSTWEDPALVQLWGPRFSAYVVAAADRAVFSLGRLPDDAAGLRRAVGTADRLDAFLAGRRMPYGEAGRGLGINPNSLRYAAATGRVLIRWDGARQPTIWSVPAPEIDSRDARLELARRYLHVFGPSTQEAFARWAGIGSQAGRVAFDGLATELTNVRTPIGESVILAIDEPAIRAAEALATAPARLLPSGDAYFLLQGPERPLLVPDPARRSALWTPRVWPGAVLVDGEVAGVWRRADAAVTVKTWRPLTKKEREAIDVEATGLPLPGTVPPRVAWDP